MTNKIVDSTLEIIKVVYGIHSQIGKKSDLFQSGEVMPSSRSSRVSTGVGVSRLESVTPGPLPSPSVP